jgi:hypothetical protein
MKPKVTQSVAKTAAVSLLLAGSIPTLPSCANTLFGGVNHSEVVPPAKTRYPIAPLSAEVPSQGTLDVRAAAPQGSRTLQNPIVKWMWIPKWMAGSWTKQGDQTVSYTDLRTGVTTPMNEWTQDVATLTWGNQIDGQGNIWHAYLIPWERHSISNGKSVKFIIVDVKREGDQPDQLVGRVHSIVTERIGAQIVDSFQQEALNDYFVLPSGQLENHSSNRDFTNEGQPIREGMLVSRFTKVGPFVPVATMNGIDLLKSLNDYLRAHNMSQLVRFAR